MKLKVSGVTRRTGKSVRTGNEYDMSSVHALMPIPHRPGQNSQHFVAGTHSMEFGCSPEVAQQLLQEKDFPKEFDFVTEPRQTQNGVETHLSGVKA